MKFIDAIQFKDEDVEETVATIHKGIRHLGKAGWKSTLIDNISIANQKSMVFRFG